MPLTPQQVLDELANLSEFWNKIGNHTFQKKFPVASQLRMRLTEHLKQLEKNNKQIINKVFSIQLDSLLKQNTLTEEERHIIQRMHDELENESSLLLELLHHESVDSIVDILETRADELDIPMTVPVVIRRGATPTEVYTPLSEGWTPLLWAAHKNDVEHVKLLLQQGADSNQIFSTGATSVMVAAEHGHVAIVNVLILANADLNQSMPNGMTPLMFAVMNQHLQVVQRILSAVDATTHRRKVDVNTARLDGWTPLLFAIETGNLAIVETLLREGAKIDKALPNGTTPMMLAAEKGFDAIVEMLHAQGAKLDEFRLDGGTPLMDAVIRDRPNVVETLLRLGANPTLTRNHEWTPFLVAIQMGRRDVAEIFYLHRPKLELPTDSALKMAIQTKQLSLLNLLLQEQADVNKKRKNGWTPLIFAIETGDLSIVNALLAKGAKWDQALPNGVTPLMLAAEKGYDNIVKKLISLGAKINQFLPDGYTHLMSATITNQEKLVRLLIDNGASIHQSANDEWSAFSLAIKYGHTNLIELFFDKKLITDVNQSIVKEKTPLLIAASMGQASIINLLLLKGANIERSLPNGTTPLMIAAQHEHLDALQVLMQKGAEWNRKRPDNMTPLMFAAKEGKINVIKILLEGSKQSIENKDDNRDYLNEAPIQLDARLLDYAGNITNQFIHDYLTMKISIVDGVKKTDQLKYEVQTIGDIKDENKRKEALLCWFKARNISDTAAIIRTNSPVYAAESVIQYLEKDNDAKEDMTLGIKRAQMILYIADHPEFPLQVIGKNKNEIYQLIKEYAEKPHAQMNHLNLIKPEKLDRILLYAFKAEDYLDYYCRQKIKKLQDTSKMYQPHPNIDHYKALLALNDNETKAVIVEAMKKNPDYLEQYHFKMKEAVHEPMKKLLALKRQGVLDFPYQNQAAIDLVNQLKEEGNQYSERGIATKFINFPHSDLFVDDKWITKKQIDYAKDLENKINPLINQLKRIFEQESKLKVSSMKKQR